MSRTHRKLHEKWRQIYLKPDIDPRTSKPYISRPKWTKSVNAKLRGDDGSTKEFKPSGANIDHHGGFKIDTRSICLSSKHMTKVISKARRAAGKKLIAIGLEDYEEILDDLWFANQGYLDDDWYDSQERRNYEEWLDDLEEEERQADYDDWYDDEPYDPYDDWFEPYDEY